jgi:electron transport complex protein RnfB
MAHATVTSPAVALIDERACIGCTLCIQACPVDAIVGASQLMHTIIADECIGCRLCLPPCPVDCISMIETGKALSRAGRQQRARRARMRYSARLARLRERSQSVASARKRGERGRKEATIGRAMQRARERLRGRKP